MARDPETARIVRRLGNKAISRTASTGTSSTRASLEHSSSDQDQGMNSSSELGSFDGASTEEVHLAQKGISTKSSDVSEPLISHWEPKGKPVKPVSRSARPNAAAPLMMPPVATANGYVIASVAPPTSGPTVPVQCNFTLPRPVVHPVHQPPPAAYPAVGPSNPAYDPAVHNPAYDPAAHQAARIWRSSGGMPIKVALSSTLPAKQLDPEIPAKKKPPYPELVEPRCLDPAQPVKKHVNPMLLNANSFLTPCLQDLPNILRCY